MKSAHAAHGDAVIDKAMRIARAMRQMLIDSSHTTMTDFGPVICPPMGMMNFGEAARFVHKATETRIGEMLKMLLEQKHLYQSLDVVTDDVIEHALNEMYDKEHKRHLKLTSPAYLNASEWFLSKAIYVKPAPLPQQSATAIPPLRVDVSDIKTFCQKCDRLEPFNLVATDEFLVAGGTQATQKYRLPAGMVQNFVLSFLCQACKSVPEVFLVRRVGPKITLCGRSPIEHVHVEKYIPVAAKQYVSGAIVAHQSGQTLAGLFLLRTSIEQWIRSLGAKHEMADQAVEWYMSTLPDDFKSRFPSLREVYGQLSDAIHKADASETIFDKAKADIEKHFEARRLYELKEPKAP